MEFQNIPLKVIVLLLIQAFWIISFFMVLQHVVIRMIKKERWHDWLAFYVPLIRNIVWILFVVKIVYTFGKYQPLLTLALTGIILGLTWTILRDFVQGTVFRFQKGDIIGQQIQLNDFKGRIIKMGETKMSIELKNGEIVQLPYSKLFTNVLIKPISNRQIKNQTLILAVSNQVKLEELKTVLVNKVIAYPWVVIKNGINIEFFNDEQQQRKVKLSFAISSNSKGLLIEEELRSLVAGL
ncbi:MAG: mechanosensitive ion channel [Flavobacteriales bacterium]|jgi:small-conductance mechanosensitive channel|nr:mechanosensitive ion channel [Flavobacteriales bacterium]